VAVAALMTAVGVSCDRQAPPAPLPPPPAVVDITMRDYEFRYDPDIPPGRVVFRVRNAGPSAHEVDLVSLPEDMPPIDEQLRGSERRFVDAVAVMPTHQPGTSGVFAADLRPGRYALVCFLLDAEGKAHALRGMNSEFHVTGAFPPAARGGGP